MTFHLVVTQEFSTFKKGEKIVDPDLVEAHKDSPFVVKVAAPDPAPAKAAEPAKAS